MQERKFPISSRIPILALNYDLYGYSFSKHHNKIVIIKLNNDNDKEHWQFFNIMDQALISRPFSQSLTVYELPYLNIDSWTSLFSSSTLRVEVFRVIYMFCPVLGQTNNTSLW